MTNRNMLLTDKRMTKEQFKTYIDEIRKMNTAIQSDEFKKGISYIYPVHNTDSFHVIASNHVKYLRDSWSKEKNGFNIHEVDWSRLGNIDWTNKSVLLHPILYPFASPFSLAQNSRHFAKLLSIKCKVGGFDVADTDKISQVAVEILNRLDLVVVPSSWAKDSYVNSGVKSPVEILPHGIPDEFLNDNVVDTNNDNIIMLRKMKEQGNILVLFFLLHSHRRKGVDLVEEVMRRVQSKHKNVILVVKGPGVAARNFSGINVVGLRDWMSATDIKLLYDTCDILVCPSRGGGFELNALEAVSRGIPALVSNGGCFLDYIDYFIPINIKNEKVQPLIKNPIHIGYGFEADINDFEIKLTDVINNLDSYKQQFGNRSKSVREKCSWRITTKKLEDYLIKYQFVE